MRCNVYKSELFKPLLTEIASNTGAEFRRYSEGKYWSKWGNVFIIDNNIADESDKAFERGFPEGNVFYQIGISRPRVKHCFVLILCEVNDNLLEIIEKLLAANVTVVYDKESLIRAMCRVEQGGTGNEILH